ncbi:MAG: nicotinate phosphoribosyltransferase [Proteobacteria bacterium]|nr:nicotinate phosphoribosyltransferase [Pseudomonadota bacterium]
MPPRSVSAIDPGSSLLLTDLYELNMLQAYLEAGMTETAVFEFFVRRLPPTRGFLIAAGLEQVVEFLEGARFGEAELDWLAASGRFSRAAIAHFAAFRFTGSVHAVPEGTAVFPSEPILRVTAPLPEAQLIETRVINLLNFQTLIASKAARLVLAASGKMLVDFGLRRAHGAEAGLLAARASYLAGFAGSATTLAAPRFGLPVFGTMAHSFIQAHDSEEAAFAAFARSRPENVVLLIDTFDTEAAARKVVALAARLKREGIAVRGVRLDSGDLADHARKVRAILDEGNLREVTIFASGGLDEETLLALAEARAPIDGFGVGTSLTTSADAPCLDCAYKLQEYAGRARRKRSEGKATWPGRKQVFRRFDAEGRMTGDVVTLEDEAPAGEPLLASVMREGRRIGTLPPLAEARERAARELRRLPERLRRLATEPPYPVEIGKALVDLAAAVDREEG